jgi:methylmalonyl-CoA mutase N-terminal domain/subunit
VEEIGGVLPAIDAGYYQQEISTAAYRYQREIDARERKIIGVNAYADPDEQMRIPILKMDPQGYERQVGRLERLRAERDATRVAETLAALRAAAESAAGSRANTMPYILDAVRAYATLGEITDVFRAAFGTYEEPNWI